MNASPIKKAFVLAAITLTLAGLIFGALVYIALNVPEDQLMREPVKNAHSGFMPPDAEIPAGMIFIREYTSTNQDIAEDYTDPQDALSQLNGFERQDGLSHIFASKDRCTRSGPRYLSLYIDSTSSRDSTRRYMQVVKAENQRYTDTLINTKIGDEGYQLVTTTSNYCSDTEQEIVALIAFRRDRYMVTVSLSGVESAFEPQDLFDLLLPIAKGFDQRLAQTLPSP